MRLDALAQRVGGELAGDPGLEVHQVAPPEDARPGTIVVVTELPQAHPTYGKRVSRSRRFLAHDEAGSAGVGDLVRIMETRPMSARKRWRLVEILEKAK